MKRNEVLDAAKATVCDRQDIYGKPENNFLAIANAWGTYLGFPLSAYDVCIMMILLKVARAKTSPSHTDNLIDIAGYAALAAEVS